MKADQVRPMDEPRPSDEPRLADEPHRADQVHPTDELHLVSESCPANEPCPMGPARPADPEPAKTNRRIPYLDLATYLAATGYYERLYVERVNEARRARGENPIGCPRWAKCAKRWVAHERRRGRHIRKLCHQPGVEWCQRCVSETERLPLGKNARQV